MSKETKTVNVEFAVEVPTEDWIEYLTKHDDIFMSNYCGYWLRGVERDDERGWLCWEDDEKTRHGKEPNRSAALAAWHDGKPLPAHWFHLDEALAIKAYVEGVKRWGADWFEHGDATRYDVVIQLAMLGEVRYA